MEQDHSICHFRSNEVGKLMNFGELGLNPNNKP